MALQRHAEKDLIESDTLKSTTIAGVAAVLAAVAGALPSILKIFEGTNVPTLVQFGGVLLIGLAAIAWAIATAGDALARAYASGHVKTDTNKPALADALEKLAASYEKAAFGSEAANSQAARKPATAQAIERLADAQENAALGTTSDSRAVPDRAPALARAICELAKAHRDAALGVVSEKKGVEDQRPGVAVGLEALAAALSAAPSTGGSALVPVSRKLDVTIGDKVQHVLGALPAEDGSTVRLLVVDDSGTATLLGTIS